MTLRPAEKILLVATTFAAIAWIVWLVCFTSGSVFSQEGVLRFFPLVPLAFIYLYILGRDTDDAAETGHSENTTDDNTHTSPK